MTGVRAITRIQDADDLAGVLVFLDFEGAVADGSTDTAVAINTALAAAGPGVVMLGRHGPGYALAHPVIVPNGVALTGQGAMQGGSTLRALSTFPHAVIDGTQMTPANSATPFTLTVKSVVGAFPLAAGGITPPGGVGVVCVAGITIFYTGATATTFTGCLVGNSDVNVVLADGRDLSTFLVWLCAPAETTVDFGGRVDSVWIDANETPGSGCIHSSHIQEGSGFYNVQLKGWRNFGVRIDEYPAEGNAHHATNYEWGKVWSICSHLAEAEAVGVDIMHSFLGSSGVAIDSDRGGYDGTFVVQGNVVVACKAAIRLNGASGSYGRFHVENHHAGIIVGDVYRSDVDISNVQIGTLWGTNPNDAAVQIGSVAGNSVTARHIRKAAASTAPHQTWPMIVDLLTGFVTTDETVDYRRYQDGTYSVNGGCMVGLAANKPSASLTLLGRSFWETDTKSMRVCDGVDWYTVVAGAAAAAPVTLVQDSVATGARDNSSASTIVLTVAKTVSSGNLLAVFAGADANRVVSSAADSRGNTWHTDGTHQGVGTPTACIATCVVTTPLVPGDTITLTLSGASLYATATCAEFTSQTGFSGTFGTRLDQIKGNAAVGPSVPATLTPNPTAQPNELILAVCGCRGSLTAGTNHRALTSQSSGAGAYTVFPEYRVVTQIGTYTPSWKGSVSNWECISAFIKPI